MKRKGNGFLLYCIDIYKFKKKKSGKKVIQSFEKYDVIEYIVDYYDVLHILEDKNIIKNIDKFIRSKKRM